MLRRYIVALVAGLAVAESGLDGWLRYAPIPAPAFIPATIAGTNASQSSPVHTACEELRLGLHSLFGTNASVSYQTSAADVFVGTVKDYNGSLAVPALGEDGFTLQIQANKTVILGQNERGALYGAFEYLSRLAQGNFSDVNIVTSPSAPIRWVNQWDNPAGTIERGYAGPSIFFQNGSVVKNLTRVAQYGRLLASIRVNGIVINNVNADASLLNAANIQGIGRVADALRPYGVRVGLSINFASPQTLGGLDTFDPLDARVISWWGNVTGSLYQRVPDLAGYLIKANSEDQPGPLKYNRTLAQGANLFAKALKPHGGIVMFRAFVYDQHIDEANWKADRANAAVDFLGPLDGQFDDNVVVQIKYGPIDFQVREPASPLFSHLQHTNTAIELQVTQEYLGQQAHLVYLPPLWKTILDFDMRVGSQPSLVKKIISGQRFSRTLGGYAAVVNVGTDPTWLGSHIAMSNLYAYGRMAWDDGADSVAVLENWTRLTFGSRQPVIDTIKQLSLASWPAYENYTGNLGIQTLTDITGNHYGPNPASQDGNGWGQWTRADATSIGMDRTVSNGTGFSGQYPPEVARVYENVSTTPENLLLWFHHLPYTYRLGSGQTIIQSFYDRHYSGSATVQGFVPAWEALQGQIDEERFQHVLYRLKYQAGHAIVWRDAINTFYLNLSGIADAQGRVGHDPTRIEAEAMKLSGYTSTTVRPAIAASGGRAIITSSRTTAGNASTTLQVAPGQYSIAVNYFDISGGRAHWEVYLQGTRIGNWTGNAEDILGHAASTVLDGGSAIRITLGPVKVARGDVLTVVGRPDGSETAPLDYISLLPVSVSS